MDIADLLQSCKLSGMFPGGLHRQDIFSITHETNKLLESVLTRQYDLLFLQKIVFYNGHCRRISRNAQASHPHPLDISTVVFLCCSFIARQDLVSHFWGCKHAFPLVVKTEQLESPTIYIWPMKSLLAKCYDSYDNVTQRPVVDFNMKVVSAIRFGRQTVSKSNILNMIISKSGKEHSFFFHRDLEGTTKNLSEICDGMIEACPVFNAEDPPTLYLNLRGNCKHHCDQLKFVLFASDIIVLFCKRDEIDGVKSLMQNEMFNCKCLLIIFCTDLSVSEEDISVAEDLENFCKQSSIDNLIVALEGVMQFDWKNDVVSAISNTANVHSINDLVKIAEANDFYIDLDRIKKETEKAEEFTNQILKLYVENQVELIFPIQGQESLEWSRADMEIYKLRCWKTPESVRLYRDRLEKKKKMSRLKQLELIREGKSCLTYQFLRNVDQIRYNVVSRSCSISGEQNEIFLRVLKLNLENATRSSLNRIYKNYADTLSKIRLDLNCVEMQQTLDALDKKINENSLSISHFTREMGQIYEAIVSQCRKEECDILEFEKMPSAAVTLLLHGYHVEIMDGRVNYVPLKWVKGIMYELRQRLGNVRLKVVSVLGVQSTGKSTLLNIMFGSQFAEGSGRCTRGLYLHLVKVSPDCVEEFNCDYLFVVDTEGLFSLPLESETADIDRKDRELATFVIGISNITIINIMGENVSYLKDILPISVHAFLRMDLVGLKPNCVLLHQNVSKGDKYHLLQQTHHLERLLDDYTSAACKLENVGPKRFKDIINFDIAKDVYYFPPLYNSHDMINPHFSENIESLRKDIMAKSEATVSLKELTDHIGYVWDAVKRDNFVFEFKNTTEIKARTIIDRAICRVQWELRTTLQEISTEFNSEMNKCTTTDALIKLQHEFDTKICDITCNLKEENRISIMRLIPSTIIGKSILRFQNLVNESIKITFEDNMNEFANLFKIQVRRKQKELEIVKCDEIVLREIDSFLEEKRSQISKLVSSDEAKGLSDNLFYKWLKIRQSDDTFSNGAILEEDASSCIFSSFPTRHAKINEQLDEKSLSDRNLTSLLSDIPITYWSSVEKYSEKQMAIDIVNDMMVFLQHKLHQIDSDYLTYGVGIFKDIILHLRNHRYISEGSIHTKPVFEIDVAIGACGEFIQRFKTFHQKHRNLNRPFQMHLQHYFQLKVREIGLCQTDLIEAVENFSDLILEELEHYIVSSISQEIAIFLMNKNQFLSSKHGLLTNIYDTLIENLELPFIRICLHSFELSARSCVSKLFDSISGPETDFSISPLKIIIEEYFDKQTTYIHTRLEDSTMNKQASTKCPMKQSIYLISSALNKFLPVTSFKVFENDRSEDIEPTIFISMLVANLKKESVLKKYLKKIMYRVLETEEYDNIKYETVTKIISPLIGCTEKCPLCGEVCCIGQMNHSGKHRSLMHRPLGINGNCVPSSRKLSSLTCWEEMNSSVHDEGHDLALTELRDKWYVPSDMCADDNSFWKLIYLRCFKEIAKQTGNDEPDDIPKSWYDLNKDAEINKLWLLDSKY